MAEINIQKKSSLPWLWIILALLVAALLLWWLLDDDDREDVAAPIAVAEGPVEPGPLGPVEPVAPAETTAMAGDAGANGTAGGPITDLATLTGAASAAGLAGREVRLDAVPVAEMVSDAGFWIGTGQNRVYVLLNEQKTPNTPIEGRVDVNAGQTVRLVGAVKTSADAVPAGLKIPAGVERFIWAQSAEVVSRP